MKITKATTARSISRKRTGAAAATSRENVIELVPSPLELKSILVPIDFSPASKRALQYALRFAEQFGGKVTLLFVIEPIPYPDFAFVPGLVRAVSRSETPGGTISRNSSSTSGIVIKSPLPGSFSGSVTMPRSSSPLSTAAATALLPASRM